MKNEFIITGASRGFGRCIAEELANSDTRLHLISRSKANDTAKAIRAKNGEVKLWQIDLSQTDLLEEKFTPVLDEIAESGSDFTGLISNAGTLKPIGPLGKYGTEEYRTHLELNYVSPAILAHLFVKKFQNKNIKKRLFFVGSGASKRPIHGWSHYCSTKAGVDMLARTIALEQDSMQYPVETAVFNPGRIETDMQALIREMDEDDFPLVDDFIASEKDGRNASPRPVAQKMVSLFTRDSFPHGEVVGR